MSREGKFTVGDFWLDKRRDGLSPDIWQIASYRDKSRSVVYRSTKCRTVDVEAAKEVLRAHEAEQRSKRPQDASEAELVPHLFNYIREHGPDVLRLDTIKSSFRAWLGFLMQDELTTGAKVADLNKVSVTRFRRWRMNPHEYSVEWGGKVFHNKSAGVTGETVQRNIEDMRSALYHAEAAHRIIAPKIPSVAKPLRSKARDITLSFETLGAIWAYARDDIGAWRWIALMMGSVCRPGAALAFDPKLQWHGDVIDMQHPDLPETDKRRPVVPTIAPLWPILDDWWESPHPHAASRKTWWRTMRKALHIPADVDPYAIRHTISTYMDRHGVPGAQISGIVGHLPSSRGTARTTSQHYLHYDPQEANEAKAVLTNFFESVAREADKWAADHRRTKPVRGKPISIDDTPVKAQKTEGKMVGADGLEPPTLSV